jgi:hypothetical protein
VSIVLLCKEKTVCAFSDVLRDIMTVLSPKAIHEVMKYLHYYGL